MKRVIFTFLSIFILLSTILHAEVPTKESVTKLYVATFNRAPDAAGLNYWLNDSGLQLEQIAQSFFDQPETHEAYPSGSTNTDFIKAVYQNLFNRVPDQAGLEYWIGELNSGSIAKSVFILAVINGAQDTEAYGYDATILENKKSVGIAFVDSGLNNVNWAKDVMGNITADIQSVEDAMQMIEDFKNPNSAPVADAGADKSVEVNHAVTVTGNGSDSDGTIQSYEWKESSTVLANSASFIYTPTSTGVYTLTFIVTDNDGAADSDTMDVNVTTRDNDNDYIPNDIEDLLGMDRNNPDEDNDGTLDGLQSTGSHGDTFFDKQWYIHSTGILSSPYPDSTTTIGNDLHIIDVYHKYMGYNAGRPLVVQVVDSGVDVDHEDLIANMDLTLSRNSITETMGDPVETSDSSHGTMSAGIIGARAFNGKGIRGVAPFVKIAGSNLMKHQSLAELEEVWTKNDPDGKIILACSGWARHKPDTSIFEEDLMAYAANYLRKVSGVPKGKLFVRGAGNNRIEGHDTGLEYPLSNPYAITVAALDSNHTHASYSSPGSSILVSGYGGEYFDNSATISTTYISGRSADADDLAYNYIRKCYERSSDHACSEPTWEADTDFSYTYAHNGTSSAISIVSGSLALALEACPTLPWRDVRYLIAKNATQVDITNSSWVTNSAGLHHSIDYGFGLINIAGMINECQSGYTMLPASSTFTESFDPSPDIAIPDNNPVGISYDFTIREEKTIEWLGVTVTSDHSYGGDLEIYLTSPSGTTTRLMRGKNCGQNYSLAEGFRYGSVAFLGESSVGTWTIKIADLENPDTGHLEKLTFKVFGH